MNGNSKQPMPYHQPPINPFRTPPRAADEMHSVLLTNPWLKSCYVVAVVALTIAVLVVASTAVSSLNPIESSPSILSPHRLTSPGLKPPRLGSGGVQSLTRLPPIQRPNTVPENDATSVVPRDVSGVPQSASPRHLPDDEREYPSAFPQEDETDLEEGLIRPGDAQLRIIGEAKEKVKEEMDREAYSDHAFGVQQDGDRDTAIQGDQQQVHVVRRKSEVDNLRSTVKVNIDQRERDAFVNSTSRQTVDVDQAAEVLAQTIDGERNEPSGKHAERIPAVAVPIASE